MSKVEWLCARCAKKEDKETEPDPVVLRLCTSCKVENWVRPFAHFGEAAEPTPEEIEEAKVFHEQKLKVLKKATKNRKEKEAEDYKEAEKQVLEAETVPEKIEKIEEVLKDPEIIPEAKERLEVAKLHLEVQEANEKEADSFEEDNKLVIEARKGKDAEIAALKAQLAELEK